ncbi:MAG: hypothetical protein LBK61_00530 [Spirochaetaceae bacterium]|nr:hypothetical protein [Spirochaetaceae bacterium]
MNKGRLSVFLKTGFCLVVVLFSCENGGGGFHDSVNNAIIPAVFTGLEVVSGNCSKEGDRLVMGTGETVLNITLENSRNTQYTLEISGDEGFVKTHDFDGFSRIGLTLECPEGKEGEEKNELEITLHLAPTMAGRAQPEDYRLRLAYALGQIRFLHIIPNTISGPVTKLVLVLAGSIPSLSENDISVTVDSTDLGPPNSFTNISDGIYEIGIDAATPEEITVEIAPAGYKSVSKSVNVKATVDTKPGEIKFLHAVAHDSSGTTTKLMLVFDPDIPGGLSSSEIAVTEEDMNSAPGSTSERDMNSMPEKDMHSPSDSIAGGLEQKAPGIYELEVNITKTGILKVKVEKTGHTIVPDSQRVEVHYAAPAVLRSVTVSEAIENGTLVPFPSEAKAGQTVTVYLYPAENCAYKEESLGPTNVEFVPQSNGIFTFTMPDNDVELTALFFQAAAKLAVGRDVRYFETLEEAFTDAEADTGEVAITVLRNASVEGEITVKGKVTLFAAADGGQKTISRGNNFEDSLFTVDGTGASLTLDAGYSLGLALDGDNISANAPLVRVSGGTLTMKERVTLKNNSNAGKGGGVHVNGGTFTMNGGTISGNTPSQGGGVYVDENGTFTMNGGTISGNTASQGGGGVYVTSSGNGSTFNMSGDAVIRGNTAANGNGVYVDNDGYNATFTMSGSAVVKEEVYFWGGMQITVLGPLSPPGGVSATITLAEPDSGWIVLTGKDGVHELTESDIAKFTLSGANAILFPDISYNRALSAIPSEEDSAKDAVYLGEFGIVYGTFQDVVSSVSGGTEAAPAIVYIANDVTLDSTVEISGKHIKLKVLGGENKTVKRGNINSDSLFTVGSNASLTLDGSGGASLVIDGGSGSSITATAAIVSVNDGGTLTMNDGVILQNNSNDADGAISGGVSVNSGGMFKMTGGKISNNKGFDGGGVYVSGGTFEMSGGTISGNISTANGGGIHLRDNGTFNMTGGEISGNKVITDGGQGDGGGIYQTNSTFMMSGGIIYGKEETVNELLRNTATNTGAAFYHHSGTVVPSTLETSNYTINAGVIGGP